MKSIHSDFLVIGSGVAGLYTALKLQRFGQVVLITKAEKDQNNSAKAQGGIAVALSAEDSPEKHVTDTLATGCGLSETAPVEIITQAGKEILQDLIRMGVPFDRNGDDSLKLGREGHHSVSRIVHALGDATGYAMVRTLLEETLHTNGITILEHTFAEELIVRDNHCYGAVVYTGEEHLAIYAGAVILASGGCGQLYERTTNVIYSTGDGYALAYRAGAELADMEFVQFHPTALATDENPNILISEAVRGDGAVLINDRGEAFMPRYHPWADLAPRDIVSRAIFQEVSEGKQIFLDTTKVTNFAERFPQIYKSCLDRGMDPSLHPVPVSPAAHFMMGGVRTDLWGRTRIKGLYACGEVACTGVHGANRLASNSLLEGFVFAARVAEAASSERTSSTELQSEASSYLMQPRFSQEIYRQTGDLIINHLATKELKEQMARYAGIIRSKSGLEQAEQFVDTWTKKWGAQHPVWENMGQTAALIVRSALYREESRGAHFRSDFPDSLEAWQEKRTVWTLEEPRKVILPSD